MVFNRIFIPIARRVGACFIEIRWIGIDKYSTGKRVIEKIQKFNGIANFNIAPSAMISEAM